MPRLSLLYLNVLVVATCGLVYELLAGTLASHVLGDSVTQFSIIIGLYLSAMGVGSWLSGHIERGLATRFLDVELGVALLGGLSAPMLLFAFARLSWFPVVLYGVVFLIGTLVGLEIPLLMRICKDRLDFKDLVSRILSFDYLGALVASIAFPLFFVPTFGLVRTSIFFGLCNAAVAMWGTFLLAPMLGTQVRFLRARAALVLAVLAVAMVQAERLTEVAEQDLFVDPVVHARTTPYQRIVVTKGARGFSLFLNGNLQFAEHDEYRYHEALVLPAFAASPAPPRRVLVLGGGDGLAVREVLRAPSVEEVVLVDLDPAMTALARDLPAMRTLNGASVEDPRVTVVNEDASLWIERNAGAGFDVALLDFPDPNNYALGKLYTRHFYQRLAGALTPDATVAIQTTSPLYARRSFWTIVETLQAAGWQVRPYHVTVPSFGVWGYALVRRVPFDVPERLRAQSVAPRFLTDAMLPGLFIFPPDMDRPDPATDPRGALEVNRLDNQSLVREYEREWRRWE
ncbi:MAG: polyamine aminopropyltransferase [Bradymonadia bacterium]